MTEIEKLRSELTEQARQDSIRFIQDNIDACSLRQCEIVKMMIMHSACYKERIDAEKL